ncbi:MAG TPA: 6-phosphogluconolactonase [Nitrospira sp.]|nr:6-phosphogluconolactonase [Nitrospira sp.]
MRATPDIRIARNVQQWAQDVATYIHALSEQAIRSHGRFLIALSGGSTPKTLFQTLATPEWKGRFKWDKILFLFGDERCVPPDHPDSNFGMARATLFQPLKIHSDHIFRMKGEYESPRAAAQEYEDQLRTVTRCPAPNLPTIDLVLLGIGEDGHTASLFPGTTALEEQSSVVTVGHAPTGVPTRITLTLGVLNRAAVVLFLVTGAGKATMVRRVIQPETDADRSLPAARVAPESGQLIWMLDQAAGAQLK